MSGDDGSADDSTAGGGTATDGTTDDETAGDGAATDAADADDARSDEFGIASNLVSGREDGADDADLADDADRTDAGDRAGPNDPGFASDARSDESGGDADAPLGSLAASVDERRDSATDRPDDELFDEEDVPEIDADAVWERLEEDERPELPEETEHDVRVVEKRSYCEQCPFFATPPDVRCTHEGTEILELVDMEHFRVVDCPKVREDERLERL